MTCKITRLSKGNGKFRTIYDPDSEMRAAMASHRPEITTIMMSQCDYRICHGFMPGRGPVTNASYHIGYLHTLSMDLTDFFDTVTHEKLAPLVPEPILADCLYEGVARQGLQTSPAFANIAAAAMDAEINAKVQDGCNRIMCSSCNASAASYTRYADDLTISSHSLDELHDLQEYVTATVAKHGFLVNLRKTHYQHHTGGRRIITGVAVDDKDVYCPRRNLRKARAAKHQGHLGSATGLVGWLQHPHLICPICWTRHRDFFGGIYQHFKHALPSCCSHATNAGTMCKYPDRLSDHWRQLIQLRGSIPDPAALYEHLREQYLIWSLSRG